MTVTVQDIAKAKTDARAREAALRDVLDAISCSRGDLAPVFRSILSSAARLCGAPMARLHLVSDDRQTFWVAAFWGDPPRTMKTGDSWPLRPEITMWRTLMEGETLHLEDHAQTENYLRGDPIAVKIVEEEGIRTRLSVPLLRGGTPIGSITLSRREVVPFMEDQIALIETFAAQAVIAIENAQQFKELQARLEREKATKEILQVISRSSGNEAPVFQAIIDNATRLCKADYSCLFIADTDCTEMTVGAQSGTSLKFAEFAKQTPLPVDPEQSQTAQSLLQHRTIQIEDARQDPIYLAGQPHRVFAVDEEGVRTLLTVPLISGSQSVGVIFLYRREVQLFLKDEVALVETFAAQAVIAIENARQFRAIQTTNAELENRLEQEAASKEILGVISQSRDDESPVFDVILKNAARLCEAPFTFLSMLNERYTHFVNVAQFGEDTIFSDEFGPDEEVPMDSELIVARAIRDNVIISVDDLASTDEFPTNHPIRKRAVEGAGIRSILCVPLANDGKAIGSIAMYRRDVGGFNEGHVELVKGFAAQAVIAIENVRQFRELQKRTEEVQALNASLEQRVNDQVGEIERMGRLKRFLSPAVAEAVVTSGDETLLSSHRALLGILFCDIRGFTAFCERAEPEETIEVLQAYHEEMGTLISAHGGGVDKRMGDGIMVLFNDPLPCEDPAGDAVRLAIAMRERMTELCKGWKRHGHRLGFGVGISLGYATIGMVGSEGRYDYTASGTSVNMAARLCDRAEDGDILLSPRAFTAIEDDFDAESSGEIQLKGLREPVEVFRLKAN